MRIAVTSTGNSLDSAVDPRFGRCPYFLFVETDDLSFEAVENPNLALGGGAGIQSAQLLADRGVTQVLTGNCGPNAYQTLSAAGIAVVVGCSGSGREVVEQWKAGQLSPVAEPNVASHFGMGPGSAPGMVQGGGGMGMGYPGMGYQGMGSGMNPGGGFGGGFGNGLMGLMQNQYGSGGRSFGSYPTRPTR